MEVEGAPKPQVWGDGERPSWLAPEDQQPKKREWSPARDRMEAALELRARLRDQRRKRGRSVLRIFMLPFMWAASFLQAVVYVGRRAEGEDSPENADPVRASSAATLDTMPAGRPLVAPPPAEGEEMGVEPPPGWRPPPDATSGTAPPEAPPAEHPAIHWPDEVKPAHPEAPPPPPVARPVVPDWDWRPDASSTRPEAVPPPPVEAPAPVEPPPAPPARAPEPLGAAATVGAILDTCVRASAAEAGIIALLQDDRLIVRAHFGLNPQLAGQLALDVMGELCLDVIAGGQAFVGNSTPPPDHDPFHPSSILCVPIPLGAAEAGVVLLAGYGAGHTFTDDHRRAVSALVEEAAQSLVDAGAYKLPVETTDAWRTLAEIGAPPAPVKPPDQPASQPGLADGVPSTEEIDPATVARVVAAARARARALQIEQDPMATITLDPAMLARIAAQVRTAREVAEKEADALAQAEQARLAEAAQAAQAALAAHAEAAQAEAAREAQAQAEEEARQVAAAEAAAVAVAEPVAPRRREKDTVPWSARVRSQMGKIQDRKEQERQRYRADILGAVRNLSWDGYHALIADVFRRKAFEVFPPPAEGTDLDVIDMVVDRDGQRRLVNCQLRGIDVVPVAAVSEMATVVYNYNVAGAYLISDGSYDEQAVEYGPTAGIVLVDSEALIDLVIETTLKDERKASVGDKLAGVFKRGKKDK